MRAKISFITTLNEGKPEECFVRIDAYQCRNGLAVGHLVKDDDGIFGYKAGWVIYHVKTGGLLPGWSSCIHKTPAAAMNAARVKCAGKFLALLRNHENAQTLQCDCPAEVVGKLKAFPKAKPKLEKRLAGTEKWDGKKFSGLLHLIGQIDDARQNAYKTSDQQITFKISRSTFTVGASLIALNRFRAMVIKNRIAFADKSFQVKPECAPVQIVEVVKAECALPIAARNLESNRMVMPECVLSDARKVELSRRAADAIANIMVKARFNPKACSMPVSGFAMM